jgi:hypothetical protein
MFKGIYGARFDLDTPRDEARSHWTNVHGILARAMGDLTYYVQSHAIDNADQPGRGIEGLRLDGYASEYYPSTELFNAAMQTEAWQAVLDDGPGLFEMESLAGNCTVGEEAEIVEGWSAPYKVAEFVKLRDGEAARAAWRDGQRELAAAVPGVTRHVQNLVVATIGMDGVNHDPTLYDGLSEWWFEKPEDYLRARDSAEWAALREARAAFVDFDALPGHNMVVEERTILVRLSRMA